MEIHILSINRHSILVIQNSRKNVYQNDLSSRENISLLNVHVTPGPHFENTLIRKLIAFILLVSASIFFFFFLDISTGYFTAHISQSQPILLL